MARGLKALGEARDGAGTVEITPGGSVTREIILGAVGAHTL